jgi:hypothetical protein
MKIVSKNIKFLLRNLVFFVVCLGLFWGFLPKESSVKSSAKSISSFAEQLAEDLSQEVDSESEEPELSDVFSQKNQIIAFSNISSRYPATVSGSQFSPAVLNSPPNS